MDCSPLHISEKTTDNTYSDMAQLTDIYAQRTSVCAIPLTMVCTLSLTVVSDGRSALASSRGRREPSLTHSTLDLPDKA